MADWKEDGKQTGREVTKAIIQVDRMLQIALILPAAVFIGWLIGAGLDRLLHQHWIYIVGIFVGTGAGIMQVFRLLHELEKKMERSEAGKSAGGDGAEDQAGEGDGRIQREPK